jgi:ribonuclease HI
VSKKHRGPKIKKGKYQYVANVDGACAGNPGPMGIGGIIVQNPGQEIVHSFSKPMGYGTNNEAEYLAVITALEYIEPLKPESVLIISDSQLAVNQINGVYGVNYAHLAKLLSRVGQLIDKIDGQVDVVWSSREGNQKADALASAAAGMPMAPISDNGDVQLWIPDPDYVPDAEALADLPETNWECAAAIKKISLMGYRAKFRDYAELRTGGLDGYSRADMETLKRSIAVRFGQDAVDWLIETVGENTEYSRKVLRWAARGLPPQMAVKKVSVDTEIQQNALNSRRTG